MASTASQFVELATMTISKYSKRLANNVLKSNALFAKMYDRKKMVTGGKDLQFSVKYKETTNITSFTDYDKFTIAPVDQFCEAKYPWAAYNCAIVFSDFEMAKNDGEERMMNLIDSRIKAAEEDLTNRLNTDLYLDGTGNESKNILGLAALISSTPTTGILGGIDRSTETFWRNKQAAASGAWGSATNLYGRKDVDKMFTDIRVGKARTDLMLMGSYGFRGLKSELESVERGSTDFKEKKSWVSAISASHPARAALSGALAHERMRS